MNAVHLGPLAVPLGPLILLGSLLIGSAVGRWAGRARQTNVEPLLWNVLIIGVLAARAAFVLLYFDIYKKDPWNILDIRDGGFLIVPGVSAAAALAGWYAWRKRERRKVLLHSVAAGAAFWVIATIIPPILQNDPAQIPQAQLLGLHGKPVHLSTMAGKPMVVNLWATWCPPCRREMPTLRDAQRRNPDIHFVFINQGETADAVRAYLGANSLNLQNVLLDSDLQIGKETGARAMPTTLFFDAQGKLIDRRLGELSEATLEQRIEAMRHSK